MVDTVSTFPGMPITNVKNLANYSRTLPPPRRQPKRRLSLDEAIQKATRREGAPVRPLLNPKDEFPEMKSPSAQQQDMEAHLLEIRADIISREEAIAERERQAKMREIELNEQQALLEAKQRLIESKAARSGQPAAAQKTEGEPAAFERLREGLAAQEARLTELRKRLREREAYIEQCEDELVEKSMQLTEREAWIEQREANVEPKPSS